MKITIVGTAYPLRGGIAHYNALLYHELSRKHDVQVVTFTRQYPSLLFPGKTQVETEGELMRVPSEALVDSINPLNWIRVGRRIQRWSPDLIIFKYWLPFFGPCFGTIARVAKRGTQTKVLYVCDNVIPHERRPGDRAFTRFAFRAADYFVVQSDAVEKELVFGYVRRYKGLHVLLEALGRMTFPKDLLLLVVGEFYDDEEQYRRQIADLRLGDRVRVHAEYVPNDRVHLFFSAADAVVLPYVSATQSGIAQIAFNFDTPVIATAIGGLQEVVRDGVTGLIVPAGDPEGLARGIERFYREGREAALRANVQKEKLKYSWENLSRAIEDLVGTG
jgi:D-inositol-3-phosphate glycosyltransferase